MSLVGSAGVQKKKNLALENVENSAQSSNLAYKLFVLFVSEDAVSDRIQRFQTTGIGDAVD